MENLSKAMSKANEKEQYQVVNIPSELLNIIKAKLGDEFIWDYDSDTNELFILKKPESYTEFLSGLGEEMWKKSNGVDYIRQERDSWDI